MNNSQLQFQSYLQSRDAAALVIIDNALVVIETARREVKNLETFSAFELVCKFGRKLVDSI